MISKNILNFKFKISSVIEEMKQKDSQWIFVKIILLDIFLYDVTDERMKSYSHHLSYQNQLLMFKTKVIVVYFMQSYLTIIIILRYNLKQDHPLMKNILISKINSQNY